MKFIDIAKIKVKAGDGGDGHSSFRKEKFVPKGGPDGGNGGRGGNVILLADPHLNTLLDFKFKNSYEAEAGREGGKSNKTGRYGENLIIKVPVGTEVKNAETGDLICDLTEHYQEFVVARGGNGGFGNAEFATATNRAPRRANPGLPGDELDIVLELKLIADIGIVGLPNVGKSTLISVISQAKPKIADYEFTTLVPNLGIVKIEEGKNFTVADIPGLIEGASEGKGLGLQFLRHVERSRALVFLLDSLSEDPAADYETLRNELIKYNPAMDEKRKIICLSRIDAVPPERREELLAMRIAGQEPIALSSVTGESVEKIKFLMWKLVGEGA
ncbi:MAG: GTPase ObgE [Chloroflexota bacterium]